MGEGAVSMVRPQTCCRAHCTELAKRTGRLGMRCGLGSLLDGGSLSAGSPGQAWWLQSWYSAASPMHGRPPLRGSGFVHVLLRTRKPSSQSREQDDHGPHAAQPPLTECAEVPPLRRRSSTRAGWGTGGETGLSDEHTQRPHSCPTGLRLLPNTIHRPPTPRSPVRLPASPSPAPALGAWEGAGRGAVPSVSQAPEPSAGQVLVSVLLRPSCRPWGSGRGARHVKRKRCSCRAPP